MKIAYVLNYRGINKVNFDRIKYFCNINDFIILDRKKFFQKILFSKEVLITDEFYLYFDVILILLFCYLTNKKITFYIWEIYSIDTQSLISEINLYESQHEVSKQKPILYLYKFIKRKVHLGLNKIIEILICKIFCDEKNILITQSELRREYLKGKFSDLNITVIKNFPLKDHLVLKKIKPNLNLSSSYIILAGRINNFNDLKTIAEKLKKENIQLILVGEETDQIKTIISLFPRTVKFLRYLDNQIILNLYRGALGGLAIYSNGSINQKFSASFKLFDMMAVGCPVIVSDNKGVIHELDGYKYPYVTIKKFNKNILENIKIQIKKSFKKNRDYIELFTYELAMKNFIDQKKGKLITEKNMYQTCSICVMDSSAKEIVFDSDLVCNFCKEASKEINKYKFTIEEEKNNLKNLQKRIQSSKSSKYDSLIGVSGGVDSSYLVLLAIKLKLNPLLVHFDNGWNSNEAISNINKIVEFSNFDYMTYVIDWKEFKSLQRSFIKANVIDIELLTDHAIFASIFKIAKENKIKSILSGTNYLSEHGIPRSWAWNKLDLRNIKDIHRNYENTSINSFPKTSTFKWFLMRQFDIGGSFEEPLNIINYDKEKAKEELKKSFDWEDYGGKHFESVFTKFYQSYILPQKFGVDKRRAHLSALIRSGQRKRKSVIKELARPFYDKEGLKAEKAYIVKKLGFSENEFDEIMTHNPVPHDFYKTDETYIGPIKKLAKFLKFKSKM